MSKNCRNCGKPTLGPKYDLCPQCHSAERRYEGRNSPPRANPGAGGGGRSFRSDYLEGGYFDEKGCLRRELIIEWPEDVARVLSDRGMTATALRRFFTQVRALETKLRTGEDFDRLRPQLLKLVSQTAYAVSRGVPGSFKEFIDRNIGLAAEGPKEFRSFIEHFECVVAFFKEKDRGRGR